MAKKIELLHTTYDKSGNIESQEVVHPLTSPDCVIMENGKTLDEVMGDGIATPTLTHEGTSFKVGVGDSNIEVVDGDVAGMTLKGQSYQNILPKPTTLIMETDEQEFKINDKIDSNIIIDDNIAEIATVKGKTIVNAVQEESGSEYTVLGEDLSGQSIVHVKETPTLEGQTLVDLMVPGSTPTIQMSGEYTYTTISQTREYMALEINTASSNSWGYFHIPINLAMLKPMTKYLVKGDLHNVLLFKISSGDSSIQISNTVYVNGANYVILQTSKTLSTNNDVKLFIDIIRTVGSICSVKNLIMVEYQEGMENWDIPYFEGEKYFEANIKGVTLQGQTLVNTIQEPCEDDYVVLGAEDGIEISAETGGHGTIEDTVQGGSIKSAILKGMTLVNLQPKTRKIAWGVFLNDSPLPTYCAYDGFKSVLEKLKPSTRYIMKFTKPISDKFSGTYFTQATTQVGSLTNDYRIITTQAELTADTTPIHLYPISGAFATRQEMYDFLLDLHVMVIEYQEGMENWDIPYFEGMQSVKMPVLKTTGKNLLNLSSLSNSCSVRDEGYYIDVTPIRRGSNYNLFSETVGLATVQQDVSNFIRLKSNTTYTLSIAGEASEYVTGSVFDLDGNRITGTTILTSDVPSQTFTTTENAIYFAPILAVDAVSNKTYTIIGLQLEEGSTATSYEPYQSSTVTTSKIQLTEAMLEQGSVDEKKPVGTLYTNIKNTPESTEYYKTRIRTVRTYKVKPNIDYQLKLNSNYRSFIVCFNDGKYMSHITWNTQGTRTFTVPSNCNEIALVFCLVNGASISASEFLNMGVELAEALTLRAIGDVKDELDLTTGKLTQRIGEIMFDGSENWVASTNQERTAFVLPHKGVAKVFRQPISDKWICAANSSATFDTFFYIGASYFNYITNQEVSLADFKAQLSNNPVSVQYFLATESVKTIDLTVTDQDGNTIPHIQVQPTVTHITASSDYLIPTVTIDNNLVYDTIIKPSTLYTVRFKHDTVNADNPLTVDLGGTVQTVASTEFTITTPSELTHNQLVFSGKNNVVSEVQVIEGDVTNIEYPFFEGMNDVKFSDSKFIARNCPFIFGKGGRI